MADITGNSFLFYLGFPWETYFHCSFISFFSAYFSHHLSEQIQ